MVKKHLTRAGRLLPQLVSDRHSTAIETDYGLLPVAHLGLTAGMYDSLASVGLYDLPVIYEEPVLAVA